MIEMLAGICLIIGMWPRGAVTLINVMLVMFLIALTIVYVRGVDINCGCFSLSDRAKGSAIDLIWRDILLLLMGLQIFYFRKDLLSIHKLRI